MQIDDKNGRRNRSKSRSPLRVRLYSQSRSNELNRISNYNINIIKASIKNDLTKGKITILSKQKNNKGQLIDTYDCKVCKRIIDGNNEIIKHYNMSHEHKCTYCKYTTYDQETLNTHINDSHSK